MIDIEDEVFRAVKAAVESEYPNAHVVGDEINAPSVFPVVSIVEYNNATTGRTLDTSGQEKHVDLMYQVSVYSNKMSGKKAEAKALFAIVNDTLVSLGFLRTVQTAVPTDDATKFRIVGRFEARTDGTLIYQR